MELGLLGFQSDALVSELTWYVLVRESLNCLLVIHYLTFLSYDLARIKRACLHRNLKVSDLQAVPI